MKINIRKPKTVSFEELEVGDLFYIDCYDDIFIKTEDIIDEYKDMYNTVSLKDGRFRYINDKVEIDKVKTAELNVDF